jgi:hypothetical protein
LDGASDLRFAGGLGVLAALPDPVLLQLLGLCTAEALLACGAVSHALRIFSASDDVWRAKVLEELPSDKLLEFRSSWRETYMHLLRPHRTDWSPVTVASSRGILYSDALYWPWYCGTASLPAEWTSLQNIPRVSADDISVADFAALYERPGQPVILTGIVSRWPAFERWGLEGLRARFGSTPFHVGGHEMTLAAYLDYARTSIDEQPLYLFDKSFAERAPEMAAEYSVHPLFAPERDLFAHLPAECRPDYRWLIVGGARSGSLWHVDPNASAAWNGLIRGRKKWLLCPPHAPPPGVQASVDGATITSPLSLYEWFRIFYPALASRRRSDASHRPREAVVEQGELLFVPRGWWHAALNLETSVAITQNYAPASSARHVMRFLASADARELVSGVPPEMRASLHVRFREVLRDRFPQALEEEEEPPTHTRGWWKGLVSSVPERDAGGGAAVCPIRTDAAAPNPSEAGTDAPETNIDTPETRMAAPSCGAGAAADMREPSTVSEPQWTSPAAESARPAASIVAPGAVGSSSSMPACSFSFNFG